MIETGSFVLKGVTGNWCVCITRFIQKSSNKIIIMDDKLWAKIVVHVQQRQSFKHVITQFQMLVEIDFFSFLLRRPLSLICNNCCSVSCLSVSEIYVIIHLYFSMLILIYHTLRLEASSQETLRLGLPNQATYMKL